MTLETLLDLVSLPLLVIGSAGVLFAVLVIYYVTEWVIYLLCISGWWRGYVLVCSGFVGALAVLWLALLGGIK